MYTPSRWGAYGCLALSMALVGSYVALSKPLAALFPILLLAWLRFGIGGVAMLRWLRRAPGSAFAGAHALAAVSGVFLRQFSVHAVHGHGREPDQRRRCGRDHGCHSSGSGRAQLGDSARAHCTAHLGGRGAGGGRDCAVRLGQARRSCRQSQPLRLAGAVAAAGAVLCEATYAVLGKQLTASVSPKRISAIVNLWGFALTTPFGLYLAWQFDFASISLPNWTLLLFYALAACVWTVWLWMTGLRVVPAAQAGVFTVMLPVSAAVVGVVALGEPITGLQLLALGIALLGVLVATWPGRR